MKFYTYQGNKISIPQGAEVSKAFRPDQGVFSDIVQAALDEIEPWERGEAPCETFNLNRWIGARVVRLNASESPIWAVNPHHKARDPGLSPFIELEHDDPRGRTNSATLELAGSVNKSILTRVYPGEYMPPVPWMKSVNQAPGGLEECLEHWNTHAFVLRSQQIDPVSFAPEWYTPPVPLT